MKRFQSKLSEKEVDNILSPILNSSKVGVRSISKEGEKPKNTITLESAKGFIVEWIPEFEKKKEIRNAFNSFQLKEECNETSCREVFCTNISNIQEDIIVQPSENLADDYINGKIRLGEVCIDGMGFKQVQKNISTL